MQFTREINRLLLGMLIGLLLMVIAATYYAVVGPQTLLNREDNARLFEREAAIRRGTVYDRSGQPLVTSVVNSNGVVSRRYYYAEMNSALGYYSLRYGVGGIEAAHNTLLRGDDLPEGAQAYFAQDVLHLPQTGSDIRITLDLNTQRQLARLMQGYAGGGVVLSVPEGEVLALVSVPTYDPNDLDANWDRLRSSREDPFFNRAVQGKYQPGGLLQTPLMAAALTNRIALNTRFEDADRALIAGNVTLNCLLPPPSAALTLQEAYYLGCPAPFADLVTQLGPEAFSSTLQRMQIGTAVSLPGFNAPIIAPSSIESSTEAALATLTVTPNPFPYARDDLLGQGTLTVSPLRMAVIIAGFTGDGRAPQPITLREIRRPGSSQWIAAADPTSAIPVTTSETARQMRDLLRQNWREIILSRYQVGGITALAYSGRQTHAWGIGYALAPDGRGVVAVVVLEDTAETAFVQALVIESLENAMNTR